MSTDLYDEFGLDAPGSDFDWDRFLPDSDAASTDREDAAAFEPEPDDSDLGFSDVLGPDHLSDQGEVHSPRVEAALTRMEHTVRSSLDADPPPSEDPDLEPELVLLPDAGSEARQSLPAVPERDDAEPEPELLLVDEDEDEDEEEAAVGATGTVDDADSATVTEHDSASLTDYDGDQASAYPPESEDEPQTTAAPAHARRRPRVRRHSRVYTATVVVACALLIAVSGVLVARAVHQSRHSTTPSPVSSAATTAAGIRAALQSATDEIDSATTTAEVGVASLPTDPARPDIAAIVNPYVESLALYQRFLSTTVPAADLSPTSAAMARQVAAQIGRTIPDLRRVDVLPPQDIGHFVDTFGTDTTRLQATLGDLESALGTVTGS